MFRKFVMSLVLTAAAFSVLASPTPKQVEDALAANNFSEAKTLVAQVLREHPDSARAHLLNAYILARVDKNKQAANNELRLVESFDKSGKVKNSPMFGRTVAMTEALPSRTVAARVERPAPKYEAQALPTEPVNADVSVAQFDTPKPKEESSHWFLYTLMFLTVVGIVIYFIRRQVTTSVATPVQTTHYSSPSSYTPSQSSYYPVSPQYPSATSSALGTAAAVAGGVVAGELVADALRSRHSSNYSDRSTYSSGNTGSFSTTTYPAPVQVEDTTGEDTEVRRDSFNSGSDSTSWSNTSTSSGSEPADNSWSNNSSTLSSISEHPDNSWDNSSSSDFPGTSSSSDSGSSDTNW